MISSAYWNNSLMGYQLPSSDFEGDRHHWADRPGRGQRGRIRYAPPAWLAAAPGRPGFPRRGGTPAPWGYAHAHRRHFWRRASRLFRRVILPSWAAPNLFRPRVGGRATGCTAPLPASAGVGGKSYPLSGKGIDKRTASSRRTSGSRLSTDLLVGRRACAMRAPAGAVTVGASQ
ncbi:hypothetical protein BN949_02815 [Agrobacterium tumefaciens]|nr:hypothetical protein BN949_02815 [Agrobacterium tumefaciens]